MRFFQLTPLRFALNALIFSASVGSVPACAQLTGQNKSADGYQAPTIKVTTRLVFETVTVKDKKGDPVEGLTAKDFAITEDGVAQPVRFCTYQRLPEKAVPLAATPVSDVKIYNRLDRKQIASETPGEVRYRDRRLLVLYFDMTAMPPTDQSRALMAAEKFVREQMTDADVVSIMRYQGSSVDILQDFTDDRSHLLSVLSTLAVGEGQGNTENASDGSSADTGAAFGQDDGEFNIFTTDRQLSALQTAAKDLSRLNEKKELIYFASGLSLNGLDNQAQLHATIDSAIRAGVSFWPVDARGLVAQGPLQDATHGSPGTQAMYTGASAMAVTSVFSQSQDTLVALAGDTGGKALLDNNDLSRGIVQAQHAESSYYMIGYYSGNGALDGKFRKINIALAPGLTAALDYRRGYWAGKEFTKFNAADKERQLEDALMLGDPITELTLAMEINYFQVNRAEYFVPVDVKIPGRELSRAKKHGAEQAVIDFIGEIRDEASGATVSNIRDSVSVTLNDNTVEQWATRPIEYDSGYTLLPGKYTIKILARDDVTGTIGTFQATFVIPDLSKESTHLPISSVVLSGQRITPKEAIYNVAKEKDQVKQMAANPLIQNGLQLIPSVTRVFNKEHSLSVFVQAYEQPVTPPRPLVAFVGLFQGQRQVYETQALQALPISQSHLQMAPLNFTVDLSRLPPGKYDCQVTVLDPDSQKGAFWRTPIMVVQ